MRVTSITKRRLNYLRFVRKYTALGYEDLGERGGRLWEIYRGYRIGQQIVDAVIPPGGMSVFVKIAPSTDPSNFP